MELNNKKSSFKGWLIIGGILIIISFILSLVDFYDFISGAIAFAFIFGVSGIIIIIIGVIKSIINFFINKKDDINGN